MRAGTQRVIEAEEIKIGAFDVGDQLRDSDVNTLLNDQIEGVRGLEVESLGVSDGELDFKGSYPDKSMYAPK